INSVAFVPRGLRVAYGCQDGNAGIWDVERNTAAMAGRLEGGINVVAASSDGRYLMIGGIRGALLVDDLDTDIVSSYLGHGATICALDMPSSESPYLVSGDFSGAVRVWPVPHSASRTIIRTPSRLSSAVLVGSDGPMVAVAIEPSLRWASLD